MAGRFTPRVALACAAVTAAGLGTAAFVGAQSGADKVAGVRHAIDDGRPKNVIMLLGDGMGDSEITAARSYAAGAGGHLRMDEFPFTGEQTTWSVKLGPPPNTLPDYVPDSAATGTAWSTGRKTADERLSQGPSVDLLTPGPNDGFTTAFELAQRAGMQTGDVSTAEITDATPAAFFARTANRGAQDEIARQFLAESHPDVVLGGGEDWWYPAGTPGAFPDAPRCLRNSVKQRCLPPRCSIQTDAPQASEIRGEADDFLQLGIKGEKRRLVSAIL